MNPTLYYEIAFVQGEEAREVLEILDREGEAAAMSHLTQWDFGGESEHSPTTFPWGTSDLIFRDGEYVMSYNTQLGYIGLCRIIQHSTKSIFVMVMPNEG